MSLVDSRMGKDGFYDVEVVNGSRYEMLDRDGAKVDILVYNRVEKEETNLLGGWYLFVIQKKKVVGYLGSFVEGYVDETGPFFTANTAFIVVKVAGKGIGGAMEKINDSLMQKWANENGDLVRVGRDWNKEKIEMIMDRREMTKELVTEMLLSRQLWLRLYGDGGGFERVGNYEVRKVYKCGAMVPQVGMVEKTNEVDIGRVSEMLRKSI